LATAATLPYAWYSDEAVLRRERERIFARSWQYVGRIAEIEAPGSFLAVDAGGIPLLLTRDRAGELRAFVNVCRHRGSILAEGCGLRETLQCPYHAWTYDLDGSLRSAPRAEREESFEATEFGLLRASVATWGPFLFANPDPDAAPLTESLGAMPAILEEVIDLGALRFHSRVEFRVQANWKVAVENFLECYHCPTVHAEFARTVDVHPDRYGLEAHPTFVTQRCAARDAGDEGQFHLLYPNLGINVFPGAPNLSIGPLAPDGPGRCARFLDYFFAPDATPEWIAEFLAFDDRIGREDTALVESVQRGMSAGVVRHGRLMLSSESLIAAFDSWISERMV